MALIISLLSGLVWGIFWLFKNDPGISAFLLGSAVFLTLASLRFIQEEGK